MTMPSPRDEEDALANLSIEANNVEEIKGVEKSVESVKMSDAKRKVTEMLNNQQLREELMDYIELQLKGGAHPSCLVALRHALPVSNNFSSLEHRSVCSGPIIPIADMRGVNTSEYSKGERLLRCKLASLYRLVNIRGWISRMKANITARVQQDSSQRFLIKPHGILYKEVTAASLVKADIEDGIIDRGNTVLGVNPTSCLLHAVVYSARPDINCVIQVQTAQTVAVSAMKEGLLPLSQDALMAGIPCYIGCEAACINPRNREAIKQSISEDCDVIFIRNYGLLACGHTIETTWRVAEMAVSACKMQMRMASSGLDNLTLPSDEAIAKVRNHNHSSAVNAESSVQWEAGALEFEAEMRKLDNMGYRTGYVYRAPAV